MSILIKSVEMPECCGYCPFEYKNYCMAKPSLRVESADRHPRCPLVPVPPHGRLIDADEFLKNAQLQRCFRGDYALLLNDVIEECATIIPAEPCNNLSKPCKTEAAP